MQPPLAGKTALVTGASRGLGEAIAIRLARDGASVALAARDAAELARATDAARAAGTLQSQRFVSLLAELSDIAQVDSLVVSCERELGGVDILVNNAAVQGPIGVLEGCDFSAWRRSFDVNLFAPARLCQLVIPMMRRRGGGKIVNVSGGGAASPRRDFSAYAAAKCALVRLTETLAEELAEARIDVNAIAPGAMNTRMLEEVLSAGPRGAVREYGDALKRSQSGGASPARAADLVALLASPACDGISGRLISAIWDEWEQLPALREQLAGGDLFTLRRVTKK